MPVSLAIPTFSVVLGGFDITSRITRLELARPFVNKDEPQSQRGKFAISAFGLADSTQYDEVAYPTRWLRCQQSLVITIKGVVYFTGFIDNYRFDRQDETGTGDIIDQIVALDFERSPAVQVPVTAEIKDKGQNDLYQNSLRGKITVIKAAYSAFPPVQVSGGLTVSAAPTIIPPAPKAQVFVFNGDAMSDVCQKLVLEAGKINGTTVFSNVSKPTLTGDRTTAVVAANPIREAQKYAGADSTWMYTDTDGSIKWKSYPTDLTVAPILQIAESQTASFKPDLTVKRATYGTYVIEGASELLTSNPDYIPAGFDQVVTSGGGSSGGGLSIGTTSVVNIPRDAVGDPYLPLKIILSAKADFADQGITPYTPKTQKEDVGYLYNQAQADKLARHLGTLEIQKSNSYLVQIPIVDEFLNNPSPFQIIHIGDRAMVINAPQLIIDGSAQQAYINFTGNVFGIIPAITNPANPPAIPAPIYTSDSVFDDLEVESSDTGAVDTDESNLSSLEIERGSSVNSLVGGFSQWHRSEEDITFATNPNIKIWGDLSANNYDFIGKAGSEPQLETLSRLNGKQVITWIYNSDAFFLSNIAVSNPCTIYMVLRTQSWTGDRRVLGCGAMNLTINGTTATLSVGSSVLTRTLALNTWALVTLVIDGANSRFKIGASEVVGTLDSLTNDFLVLGASNAFRIAEFIRYPFNLNSADDALVTSYIEDRYNLVARATDTDDGGSLTPVVPTPPPTNATGTFTSANITVVNGIVTVASNGSGGSGNGDLAWFLS